MRRKIANPEGIDGSELPELTAQQSKFVEGILAGKTASAAYRVAYSTSSTWSQNAVWVEASRLRADPKVDLWIKAARIAGLGTAVITLESHINELDRIKELALAAGNHGAAAQCEQLKGKASGHYVERVETTIADPAQTMREIEARWPDFAAKLASMAKERGLIQEGSDNVH